MSITVTNLSKFYGSQKAVDHISFQVGKGEIVGFLGPNGAGKSTTMKMITGYLPADAGTATVCGITVHPDHPGTKQKIGYLPEQNPLYYDMYVREYLQFIAGIHGLKHSSARIQEVIDLVGLTPESGKKTGQLSKGYKQRTGLAAALLHDPEVLILDEPTTGLDPNQIVEIREVIRTLGRDKTVLFSSHILQEVEAVCDRVIIINKGKIVADDLLQQLRQKGNQEGIQVTFSGTPEISRLQQVLPGAVLTALNPQTFRVSGSDGDAIRKALMQFSLDENINIEQLQREAGSSLESVFRQLTATSA